MYTNQLRCTRWVGGYLGDDTWGSVVTLIRDLLAPGCLIQRKTIASNLYFCRPGDSNPPMTGDK